GLLRDPDPDEGRGGTRQAGPDGAEGWHRAAVLPDRDDLCAGEPQARARGLRLRRGADVRRCRRSEGRGEAGGRDVEGEGGGAGASEADDGEREPALPRGAGGSDAGGVRADEPGAGGDGADPDGSEGAEVPGCV